jgi:hypothetical protein
MSARKTKRRVYTRMWHNGVDFLMYLNKVRVLAELDILFDTFTSVSTGRVSERSATQ